MAEYANIFVVSSVSVTLFWGGWLRPFPSVTWLDLPMNTGVPILLMLLSAWGCWRMKLWPFTALLALASLALLIPGLSALFSGPFWFFFKVSAVFYVLVWFRASWPRLRYDQLMDLGWKRLIPLALGSLLGNAVLGML